VASFLQSRQTKSTVEPRGRPHRGNAWNRRDLQLTFSKTHLQGGGPALHGRLTARPQPPVGGLPSGLQQLALSSDRDGYLYVPATYRSDSPAPVIVLLHGAGGDARGGLSPLLPLADEAGLILVSPDSRLQTWDVLHGSYGPDVAFIDRALEVAFRGLSVDTERIGIGGFSDGASYALSLGLTNGDLFTHILAFSPGFASPASQHGAPRIFVSHGIQDTVLPIDVCSRRLVPRLESAGHSVRYVEFDGPHTVPATIARASLDWFQDVSS
jgi:phospholipase/carboxylesterase